MLNNIINWKQAARCRLHAHVKRTSFQCRRCANINSYWFGQCSGLFVYCKHVMSYMVDQNIKILFWKKALNCDNRPNVICTLAVINKWKFRLFLSKYLIPSINIAVSDIKSRTWKHFVDMAHNSGKYCSCGNHDWTLSVYSVFLLFYVFF